MATTKTKKPSQKKASGVSCGVNTCNYNCESSCTAGKITVGAMKAKPECKDETICATFEKK